MLPRIERALNANPDVTAAWLAGSRGRGTDDDLSDIDIWVAIEDSAIGAINADPLRFVRDIAPTLMHIQAPSIAPQGGVFLLTWMQTEDGYEQVDWYWTPASVASRSPRTRLLFERRPVPVIDPAGPNRIENDALRGEIDGTIRDSLLLIAYAWKHVRRGDAWRTVRHIQHVNDCLAKLDWLVAHGCIPEFHDTTRSFLSTSIPDGKEEMRDVLRVMLDDLAALIVVAGRGSEFRNATAALKRSLAT